MFILSLNHHKNCKYSILVLIIIYFCCSHPIIFGNLCSANNFYVTLTLKTFGGGIEEQYCKYIQHFLAEIGIKVEIKVEEWIVFVGTLLTTHDFDLTIISFGESICGMCAYTNLCRTSSHIIKHNRDPDPTEIYSSKGSLNIFGLKTDIPYVNKSEQIIKKGKITADPEKRQQQYYLWQELLMDKIVPMLPLFTPCSHVAIWSNLKGYDNRWGIVDSLPYMYYEGEHEGQTSITEFVDYDNNWKELNPLLQDDISSSYISSLVMESLLKISPDGNPTKTGLIDSWEIINDSYFKFHIREGVYWNPSYNITKRTPDSDPLDPATTPLMVGLKGESSDGTNQPVTAKDAVFTYLAWANPITSEDPELYDWIKAIWIDPNDEYSFYIVIDGDPDTPELDSYAPFWQALSTQVLPEFFLNSTDTTVTYSSGGVPTIGIYEDILNTPVWKSFSVSAFGCGKYMLNYSIKNSVTVLQKSPYWEQNFGIGAIDGTHQDLDIETITIRVIPDETSALAEFKAGKLDIVSLDQFSSERDKIQDDVRFKVYNTPKDITIALVYNLRRPFIGGEYNYIFHSSTEKQEYTIAAAVRKGINYAIDRNKINNDLHRGEFFISNSPFAPTQSYWYYSNITKYYYNITMSRYWLNSPWKPDIPNDVSNIHIIIFLTMGVMLLLLNSYKYLKKTIKKY